MIKIYWGESRQKRKDWQNDINATWIRPVLPLSEVARAVRNSDQGSKKGNEKIQQVIQIVLE